MANRLPVTCSKEPNGKWKLQVGGGALGFRVQGSGLGFSCSVLHHEVVGGGGGGGTLGAGVPEAGTFGGGGGKKGQRNIRAGM